MNETYKNGYIEVGIGQLHYSVRCNPAVTDQSLLLLLNSRSRSSLKLFPLIDVYARVVSVDLPAFGMSSPMPPGCSMRDIAGVVEEFVEGMHAESIDLFGLHTGHKVAAAFAVSWPNRVRRLIISGRTHSIIPDRNLRNLAMKRTLDENQLDVSIVRMEGKYVDDSTGPAAFVNMFEANFAFDFAGAMRGISCPTLIVEILTETETARYGEQAAKLAVGMANVRTIAIPQTDPTGLDLYVGVRVMANVISDFMRPTERGSVDLPVNNP